METLISLLALLGMAYAAYRGLGWMLRTGRAQAPGQEPLSPTDLKVLEESAARLIADLTAAADECVEKVEQVLAQAENRSEGLQTLSGMETQACDRPADLHCAPPVDTDATRTPALNTYVDSDAPAADVARSNGLTTGEVELIRDLRALSSV